MSDGGKGTLRVLVVEDSEDDYLLLVRALREGGYEPAAERVQTAEAMAEALDRGPWDLVISDWTLPGFGAPQALRLLQDRRIDLPFVIVSGTVGEETAVGAMKSGAHDFLVKDRLARLVPAVQRELREAQVRRERAAMQEQLLVSDRMASVGLLSAGVAHEINNPLAALMANLDVALETLASGRAREARALRDAAEALGDARESARRIRDIVKDVRMFSRGDDRSCASVDVAAVMESALRMAWTEVRHRARLVKDYAAKVPPVEANESRLGQVFLNLVVNAAQAIPEGRVKENEIRLRTLLGADGRVVVEVRDTGAGMAPDVVERLFTPFFTTKPPGLGTGLGLVICHRIVASLGGEITVESTPGEGTAFRVHLPAARASEPEPPKRPSGAFPAPRRGRILVVDDEPLIGSAVRRSLAPDHEVVTATRVGEALDRIAAGERFDVILCDLLMPDLTGMDLHAELSRTVPDQAEKTIFLTGGAFTPRARAFLDEVPNLWLEKPFEPAALRKLINERLRR